MQTPAPPGAVTSVSIDAASGVIVAGVTVPGAADKATIFAYNGSTGAALWELYGEEAYVAPVLIPMASEEAAGLGASVSVLAVGLRGVSLFATAGAAPPAPLAPPSKKELSAGALAAIMGGSVLFVAVVVGGAAFAWRRGYCGTRRAGYTDINNTDLDSLGRAS